MNPQIILGAAIFTLEMATKFIVDVTLVLTENLPAVLAVFSGIFAIRYAFRLFSRSTRGRL